MAEDSQLAPCTMIIEIQLLFTVQPNAELQSPSRLKVCNTILSVACTL